MDSITFKNFRKFKEETSFELNNINILVGPNNSGKSTLTKGLRLYLYNIMNLKVNSDNIFSIRPFFYFGGDVFDNPHIGTFGRALSKNAKENNIFFSVRIFNTLIDTTVSRYSKHSKDTEGNLIDYYDKANAPITQIRIYNHDYDAEYLFDFEEETYSIAFNVIGNGRCFEKWGKRLEELQKNLNANGEFDSDDLAVLILRLKKCLSFGSREHIVMKTNLFSYGIDGNLYESLIKHVFKHATEKDIIDYEVNDNAELLHEDKNFVYYFSQTNFDMLDDYQKYVKTMPPIVIEAHSVTHSLVYNISDKNDYMAQTILDYISQDIKDTDPEKLFIEYWMTKFNIGEDFIIESFGGECFKFEIIEDVDYPENRTPLLDKGVGSNQIMILLLRLATIMRQNRGTTIPCTIIIEEPEQNLHPKLQSLLADLFNEVYQYPMKENKDSKGIGFLVETHSEYLVRKTQVLVAGLPKSNDNPFTVYYLPEWDSPRKMVYQANGTFANNFSDTEDNDGFYDEAISLIEKIV